MFTPEDLEDFKRSEPAQISEYCSIPFINGIDENSNIVQLIRQKGYETTEEFINECEATREKNYCLQSRKGAWNFIKGTIQYRKIIIPIVICVKEIISIGGGSDGGVKTKIINLYNKMTSGWAIFASSLSTVGSFLLHLVTGGIWGAIKAAWYVIKLAFELLRLYKEYQKLKLQVPFYLGRLIGLGLKAVKSLIFGRRKRKFRI